MFTSLNMSALILCIILLVYSEKGAADDIGTNFFLKASKSVPRIGRRSMDFDNHFLKASKSVPRIGRRGTQNGIGVIGKTIDAQGYPIIRNIGPEIYLSETGQPLWADSEKAYESSPKMEIRHGLQQDFEDIYPYWERLKKDSEIEEQRIQPEML